VGPTRTAAAAARNRLHAQRASGARGGELGRRASQPKGGRGEGAPAGPRQEADPGEKGGFFLFFYFLFSYNLLLNAYFMETKQLHTREIDAWLSMMQQAKKIFLGFSHTRSRAKSR
jgi:hypothetical protein